MKRILLLSAMVIALSGCGTNANGCMDGHEGYDFSGVDEAPAAK